MSNMFFWIIILSLLIPVAMRMYRKSVARRNYDQSYPGRYPEQFPGSGQFPGQFPGSAGPQSKQPRDGYTQQDYFSGGFRQIEQPQPLDNPQPRPGQYGQPPAPPAGHGSWAPQEPPFQQPGAQNPGIQHPGAQHPDAQQPGAQQPGGQNPGIQQPWAQQPTPGHPGADQPAAPATPPPPSAPQGFRARKLAELDQQYSNGELSMEEYMARRSDIMNG